MTGPHLHPHRPAGSPITLEFLKGRAEVDRSTGCWLWTGAIGPGGYGVVKVRSFTRRVHRVAYQIAHRLALPTDIDVCHSCDVRNCFNPEHLFHGTRTDNMRDCARKGRVRVPRLCGEATPAAKLTVAQVRAIRSDPRSNRSTARAYGVSKGTISAIRRGLSWKSVA